MPRDRAERSARVCPESCGRPRLKDHSDVCGNAVIRCPHDMCTFASRSQWIVTAHQVMCFADTGRTRTAAHCSILTRENAQAEHEKRGIDNADVIATIDAMPADDADCVLAYIHPGWRNELLNTNTHDASPTRREWIAANATIRAYNEDFEEPAWNYSDLDNALALCMALRHYYDGMSS